MQLTYYEIRKRPKVIVSSNEEAATPEIEADVNVNRQTESNLASSIARRHSMRLVLPTVTPKSQLSFISDVYLCMSNHLLIEVLIDVVN